MIQHHIITIVGDDRSGLVDSVAKAIKNSGGNWEASRLANLGGKFAGIVNLSLEQDEISALERELGSLRNQGLQVTLTSHTAVKELDGRKLVVSVVGNDRPGIVSAVSEELANFDINVEELQTECAPAPMSGEPLFYATAWLTVPENLSESELQNALEAIADDLMIEIDPDDD